MSRLENFRQKRTLRKRYVSAAVLFAFILVMGLLAVDCTTNDLMNGNRSVAFATVNNKEDFVEISLMNRRVYINTRFINRDMRNLRDRLRDLFQ